MINADKALRIILGAVPPPGKETVDLPDAPGRIAAEHIVAGGDIPPFRNSSMDGYAVRAADLKSASSGRPVTLTVAGESSAGNPFSGRLGKGQALRIMTGGKLPRGTDAVVPVEKTKEEGPRAVSFHEPAKAGDCVRLAGEDIPRGRRVIAAGELITPYHSGILAATGHDEVSVSVRPRVGILATGDELVRPGRTPGEGKIRNSSSYTLIGLVRESGGRPRFLGIVRDRKTAIREKISEGLAFDVLLLTGGVSVGAHDYVGEALRRSGVDIRFWRVNIRPGSPLLFGVADGTLVFGLPGNPVSTAVTFLQFVRPALRKMLGRTDIFPVHVHALTDEPLNVKDGKRCFLRGIAREEDGVLRVKTTGSQSSGVMTSLTRANCLILIPEGTRTVRGGSPVEVEFFHDPF
jgi:molybdopterin molybdotransferase